MNLEHTIDAVITWVDGEDELHKLKKSPYLKDLKILNYKKLGTRFNQVGEIKFVVDSILKFAPYIRTIFIVTDNQTPNFLKETNAKEDYPNVQIVDHTIIFKGYEKYLPTFNSLSIETMLTKIPDLAEHFIYFNDDIFLIRESKPTDFFRNGIPVLRGKWTHYDYKIWYKIIYRKILIFIGKKDKFKSWGFKKGQQNIAQKLGFKKYFRFHHAPYSMRKSTLNNYFIENQEIKELNIKYRFRKPKQYIAQSLANHLEIKNNTCVLTNDYQLVYFGSYKKPFLWYKFVLGLTKKHENKLFLCLQSLDQCPPNKLKYLINWLSNISNN